MGGYIGLRSNAKSKGYDKAHDARIRLSQFKEDEDGIDKRTETFSVSDAIIRVTDADELNSSGCVFYELFDMMINQINVVLSGVFVSGGNNYWRSLSWARW